MTQEYEKVEDVAARLGVQRTRVYQLLQQGRFPDAQQLMGRFWLIPRGAEPTGPPIKRGYCPECPHCREGSE